MASGGSQLLERLPSRDPTLAPRPQAAGLEPPGVQATRELLAAGVTDVAEFAAVLERPGADLANIIELIQTSVLGNQFAQRVLELREARAASRPPVETAVRIEALFPPQRAALAELWKQWAASMDAGHRGWHLTGGSGGKRGVGPFPPGDPRSGEGFLQFHEGLLAEFLVYVRQHDPPLFVAIRGQVPIWDTMQPLPEEFRDDGFVRDDLDWSVPAFATARGARDGPTLEVLRDGIASPVTIRSLDDCKNPDELGRLLGESGIHAHGHNGLGGNMATTGSLDSPAFLLWHGVIERIRQAWLRTPSGRAWLRAHPSGWSNPAAAAPHLHPTS
jgi:hypothetical protein